MADLNRLVILGAAGDLSTRFLLPAMADALQAGKLERPLEIIGVARADWDNDHYRSRSADAIAESAPGVEASVRDQFVEHLHYVKADATDADALSRAIGDKPSLIYLALPPKIYPDCIRALEEIGLTAGSRIIIEKPFGDDYDSAVELNKLLKQHFSEDTIYRIDHFTALQSVEAIPALRFANRILQPVWSREHIEQVEIIFEDISTLGGRASYYDTAGALKDMTQNHLLQILCMVAMEPPEDMQGESLRDAKVQLLKDVRSWSPDEAAKMSYRARYTAGEINGKQIPDYVDEDGVDPDNRTETFAKIQLEIDNDRWTGVPFLIRTGKGQAYRRRIANIVFKQLDEGPYQTHMIETPNALQLYMLPDSLQVRLLLNRPEDPLQLREVNLSIDLPQENIPAHGALILDALRGDQSRFIRDDEAEESWRVVQPFLDAWAQDLTPMHEYPAGTQVETN
ncbi:MAG: glucose-6-phosphate dehydrogenase [Sphaerobacteraceae bacterium]|nr:MAG: glucose-6-phosphate dehydrogenase [Sphaerobacteraceae bacterium]